MNTHLVINRLGTEYGIAVRMKLFAADEVSGWSSWFAVPGENYVELSSTGPYPLREVEWAELNPFVVEIRGRLIMPLMLNREQQVLEIFETEKIRFERIGVVFRVYLT
ncbi:DUF6678 family protein [Hymenobacter chitinivorans]|nr:DUF6678 family protein [Hymenobacter chitinivorans]